MKRQRIYTAIFAAALLCVVLAAVGGRSGRNPTVVFPAVKYNEYETADNVTVFSGEEPEPEENAPAPAHQTVNINTATAEELAEVLPGIGPVKASRIVEYREAVGGFMSVDELTEVYGIGQATLEKIRPYCVTE